MKRIQVPFFAKTKFPSIMKEEITMKRLSVITMGLLVIGVSVFGCSQQMSGQGDAGWVTVTLLDGSNPKTLGKWNTYEITAKGSQLTVVLNGIKTVDIQHGQFPEGPFSLQFGNLDKGAPGGAIKFRKVQIKPL